MPNNEEIATFARQNLNNRIGRGECWDLAEQALRAAGTRRPNPDDLYVWGDSIQMTQMQSGDILQFENFRYDLRIETSNPDGSSSQSTSFGTRGRPNHTAIIAGVGSHGSVQIWEQNVQGVRRVAQRDVYLIPTTWEEVNGRIKIVHTVTVSGSVTIYRAVDPPASR